MTTLNTRKKVVNIKKLIKTIFIVCLFYTSNTYALFTTNNHIINTLHTINYNLQLNASGGKFINKEIIINKDNVVLPIPEKDGYTFSGYKENNNIYSNETKISKINNKELTSIWNINKYSITYNLNGGILENKKDNYTIEEEIIIPNPTKEGYIFEGWTGSNGTIPEKELIIKKGTIGNLEYTANWSENKKLVSVIPVVDNIEYKDGYSDYTFNVYINDNLIVENVNTWNEYVHIGDKIRVVSNQLAGRNTTYDETKIIKEETIFNPTWTINSYNAEFIYNNKVITTTTNKYGTRVSTPNLVPSNLGYQDAFYEIKGYTPQESWIQLDKTIKFNINLSERECTASFGSATQTNAEQQLALINRVGYNFCHVTDWASVECSANSSRVLDLYYNIWYILPRSGNGYSIYKQIICTSGWTTYERR